MATMTATSATPKKERIYIGGLNPSKGLTVELVASRLSSVADVEILTINDVTYDKNRTTMYNSKSRAVIVDEDGDVVDTRNFFYVEARRSFSIEQDAADGTDEDASSLPPALPTTEETASDEAPDDAPSALDLIAKQYNSVKWKGCQLRVESAKPHFLQRLEEERLARLPVAAVEAAATVEITADDSVTDDHDSQQASSMDASTTFQNTNEESTPLKKCRRRLRIRKQFGEEAYYVDTLPHPLTLLHHHEANVITTNNADHDIDDLNCDYEWGGREDDEGWTEFGAMHKRMEAKREKNQMKLVERRKKERRAWASGSKYKKKEGKEEEMGDDYLRSLIFLNRGIHIRFDETKTAKVVEDGFVAGEEALDQKDGDAAQIVVKAVAEDVATPILKQHIVEDSGTVSSPSDSEGSVQAGKKGKAYNWSDSDDSDDDEEKDSVGRDGSDDDSATSEKECSEEYTWSDGDSDGSDGKSDSEDSMKQLRQNKNIHPQVAKKKLMQSGSEYTKATAMDEFSGGMDFDDDAPSGWGQADDYDGKTWGESNEGVEDDICLEEDISSNIGVLSKLFPSVNFDKTPLAPSFVAGSGDEDEDGTRTSKHSNGVGGAQKASSSFGMQRYDPTKESDKQYEVPLATNKDGTKPSGEEEDTRADNGKTLASEENASTKEDQNDILKDSTPTDTTTTNHAEETAVPGKDVYEQEKLENVFKQAREGNKLEESSFSLANMFQPERNNEQADSNKKEDIVAEDGNEIYEQDKLEQVFKQARTNESANKASGASSGFSFGFQAQMTEEKPVDNEAAPFSFGFALSSDTPKSEVAGPKDSPLEEPEQSIQDVAPQSNNAVPTTKAPEQDQELQTTRPSQRKRNQRVGMTIPETDLDKWEEMFFQMNEGPQIINDLSGMKHNEENQELWQKERLILTADWKRKQKSGSSRKVKKVRRF